MKHKILKFVLQDKTLATTLKNTQARTTSAATYLSMSASSNSGATA